MPDNMQPIGCDILQYVALEPYVQKLNSLTSLLYFLTHTGYEALYMSHNPGLERGKA